MTIIITYYIANIIFPPPKKNLLVLSREFSGMIHNHYNNHPSNPQQPIHSLGLALVRKNVLINPWVTIINHY